MSLKTGEYEFLIPAEQADGSSACADVEWNRQQSTASAQQAAAAPVGLDTLSQSHQQAPSSGPAAGEQAPSAAGGGTAAAAGLDSATNWEEVYQEVLRKIRSCRCGGPLVVVQPPHTAGTHPDAKSSMHVC